MFCNATRYLVLASALLFSLEARHLPAEEPRPPTVGLFDTGSVSPGPLSGSSLSKKAGWSKLPEGETDHKFRGDVVIANNRLAVVLRHNGAGAEVYSHGAQGPLPRAVLAPAFGQRAAETPNVEPVKLISVAVAENTPGEVAVEATFDTPGGGAVRLLYALGPGQAFVRTEARPGVSALHVEAPCRFVVLPDFFADDIVVDALEIPAAGAELPSENFLLHMLPGGEAVVMGVWNTRGQDARITLSGEGRRRAVKQSEIHYGKDGKVWVAVIEGPGVWHQHDVARDDAGKVIELDWQAPYPAQWRVDWTKNDKLTDSWEMLTQRPNGGYVKHGWFGQPESFGTPDWMQPARQRWTTVLGRFQYPCWVDKEGRGCLQPLTRVVRFQGPALIYPINRVRATPLGALTVVDIVRATLGVGPCEYILDVEGQQKESRGIATCAARDKLNAIYKQKLQTQKRPEVEKALSDVLAFVQHIRARIEDYVAFGHEMLDYLAQHKKAHPELAEPLAKMETLTRKIDDYVARRKAGIGTPAEAVKLVEGFRTGLVGYEGGDALERCQEFGKAITRIGGNQDELVGECRMAVKILRQQAGLAIAVDPQMAEVAKEIRRRTQAILRNPTSYEAPRH